MKTDNRKSLPTLATACLGEALGTYIMVLIGTGAVAVSVLTGALSELWQVAAVWDIAVTLAIYLTRPLSGAHLNPVVSLALAAFGRGMPYGRLPWYWVSQLAGAFLAGTTVLVVFSPLINDFEVTHHLTRGLPGSELSAMVFGEYFPNPGMYGTGEVARQIISPLRAAAMEGFGTAILLIVVFALRSHGKGAEKVGPVAPVLIGLTVAALIIVIAPFTQAGINPARDFGPRLVAYFAGWRSIAIPGPGGGFWVYIVGPLVGGLLGSGIYAFLARLMRPKTASRPFAADGTRSDRP